MASIALPFAGEICECADGAEALATYQAQRPDLVLMDIRMKEMDGIAATRQIKAAEPTAEIIIVTGYDDDALREEAMHAGARGYALKDNLLDLVQTLGTISQPNPGLAGTETAQ